MLTFEKPPKNSDLVMSREQIAAELRSRPGEWAVVNRPDRVARAESAAERISDGREFGDGFEACVRAAGDRSDVRVYARFKRPRSRGKSGLSVKL
jgi:hypothetical protein